MSSQALAATYYWPDSDPGIFRPERLTRQHRQKMRHNQAKPGAAEKEAAKPQGALIVAVSINRQQVRVYDANGVFAEAPVSTGMKGHSTPLGVFSVIQKQKFHRSNIYSGAPMPFMQRITWSGVALHAGVLPGYPASHGCIRMPPGFAVKMYGWTRMGARVLVTPGEVEPSSFTHPLLAALKAPPPTASAQPDASPPVATGKTDKGALLDTPVDLRSTIGHVDATMTMMAADPHSAPRRAQTQTADAGTTARGSVTASDATPFAAAPTDAPAANAAKPDTKADASTSSAATAPEIPTKPGSPIPTAAGTNAEMKPAEADAAKPDHAAAIKSAEKPADDAAKPATPAADADKPAESKAAESKTADTPADAARTSTDEPADAKKDQTRLSDTDKPAKPELKRNSQVAIFISRKDSKLYVRQNFAPVFNTPVTIAASDRPLGTHLFTATADKTDPTVMHWSVVTLPARSAARNDDSERASRRGRRAADAHAEARPAPIPDSPTEALDRITIPADVVAWLGEALSSGSSLIVSDQGINQGETGEGTEFILSLR
jgi:hypothetical protein